MDSVPQIYVGLDVHKDSISMAVTRGGPLREIEFLGRIPHDVPRLLKRLSKLGPPEAVHCAYEAGPTGFGLCRRLRQEGYSCLVAAPSKTPVPSGDRIKTDRRDARLLARFLRSGDLVGVHLPGEGTEALRDLVRGREDARKALMRARHQLSKFLLRHGRHWSGRSNWTAKHREWICSQRFDYEPQVRVLKDYIREVERLEERIGYLTSSIEELVPSLEIAPLVAALQAFRGIKLITAVTIVCEIADFRRFSHPTRLMSYLGLVPSESSSGNLVRRGSITKTGNNHARRVLIEAAWNYRFRPQVTTTIKRRSQGVAPAVMDIAWKAQRRLNRRYHRMSARGKSHGRIIVAMARELVGFLWDVGQQDELMMPASS
jgi:transposase